MDKKVPDIRFEGFSDDWEQRKLGESLQVNSGRDYKHLEKGEIPVYGTGGYMLSVNDRLSDVDGVGIGRKGTIDRPQYLKAPYWTVDTLFYMTPMKEQYLLFYYSLAQRINWKKLDESTGVPSLSKAVIEKIKVLVPSLDEQKKVALFFNTLDDTIALHQKQLEHLNSYKKTMLQKMFPKNMEKTPELRFPKFIEDWEQRKLGEVFQQTSKYVNPKEVGTELWSLTVEKGLTPKTSRFNREFLVKKEDQFKLVHNGEFIYNPMNMTLGAVALNSLGKDVAVSGYYIIMVVNDEFESNYFNTWLKSPQAIKLYKTYSTGTLIEKQRVQFSTLISIKTRVPEKAEQQQIGSLFTALDTTIALHQNKLDTLIKIKKSLLQKMFV